MPAAQTKDELVSACADAFARLQTDLAKVPEPLANAPDAEGWSVCAVIAHRAYWIDLFLGWWSDGKAGRPVRMPAPGYSWQDVKALNTRLRSDQAVLTWGDARKLLDDRHKRLMTLLNELDDARLYGGPMTGGNGKWTTGRYAEAAGASHYRSAQRFVRRRMKEARVGTV
ncbi:MAG: ClbS/DfsB family four-helix bundle protein [Pseudomonadota bacterium]